MAKIRLRDGINDPNPTEYGNLISDFDRRIVAIESQLNESRVELLKLKGQMAEILKLQPEDLKEALRTLGQRGPECRKTLSQLQDAGTDYIRLFNAGLGENHPRLKALRARIQRIDDQLARNTPAIQHGSGQARSAPI